MAISLNSVNSTVTNHETRIKALESKGASSWTKGSNSNGYWAKESTTGLIIQWGNWGQINGTVRTFPISFSNTDYTLLVTIYHELYAEVGCRRLSKNTFDAHSNANWYSHGWIAIGYLISDRILNYIYEAFAIIFTLIFGIRLVSKFTV